MLFRWRGALVPALVALVAFAVYAPTIGFDFVPLDDPEYTYQNPLIVNGVSWSAVKASWVTTQETYWAPLVWMSYMLDVQFFGMVPWGFHLTNTLLFALNAGLLFWLLRRWTGRTGVALAITALWALHPVRVESVAWITERKDVLSGLFFLLGVGAYVEGRRGSLRHGMLLAWLCMFLGGCAKQILIVMPAALCLLDIWPLARMDWSRVWRSGWRLFPEKWSFWLLALAFVFPPIWLHHDAGRIFKSTFGERLSMLPQHYLFYFQKNVWPIKLMPLYESIPFQIEACIGGILLLLGATWVAWYFRKKAPWGLAGWLWFVGLLFPLTGIAVWAGQERVAARFLYLPQIGLFWVAVLAVDAWVRQCKGRGKWAVAACVVLLVACGVQTARLMAQWKDTKAFTWSVWETNPKHPAAMTYGGVWNIFYGDWSEAERILILGTNSGEKRSFTELCSLWIMCGRVEEADQLWERFEAAQGVPISQWTSMDTTVHRSMCWLARGQMQRVRGDYAKAITTLKEAVRLEANPISFVVVEFLRTCFEAGRPEEGAAAAKRVREITGTDIREWRDLLAGYLELWDEGAHGQAYGYFAEYAKRYPDDGMGLNNMAWALATVKSDGLKHAGMDEWPKAALTWVEMSMKVGGDRYARVWDTLAAARANRGDFEGAMNAANRAVAIAEQERDVEVLEMVQRHRAVYAQKKAWREPGRRETR